MGCKIEGLEKLQHGWEGSYNYLWQWCQVLDQYVPNSVIDLKMHLGYCDNQIASRKRVFHHYELVQYVFHQKLTYFLLAALFPKRESAYTGQIVSGGTVYDDMMQEIR
ncbi:hypothetical protein J1N35_007778 [Gossypium stocksii]|uniref:Uncharacterized protein n=1 Tax=Gossypium stocksii TaxID=47602 RepID=A0A9D3W9U2_9ROSI|nr:hypothetical protein J1N35_007778 [Gossypium stocksii]